MRSKSAVTIVRPANATPYTAGDVVGVADSVTPANAGSAILAFRFDGSPGELIEIKSTTLRIDATSVPAGMTSFRLYLYDTAPTAILDNAAWDLPAGDRRGFLGFLDLGTPVDLGSTLFVQTNNVGLLVKPVSGSSTIYGLLVTAAGYTPASGGVHSVTLSAEQ